MIVSCLITEIHQYLANSVTGETETSIVFQPLDNESIKDITITLESSEIPQDLVLGKEYPVELKAKE